MPKSLVCVLLTFISTSLFSQVNRTDSTFLAAAVTNAKKIHAKRIVAESNLYSGSNFIEYRSLQDEHPYLFSNDWILGTVMYNNEFYDNVYLQYDAQNDILITENYNYGARIQLVKQNVQLFSLGKHHFRLLNDKTISIGFYEVLYDGTTKVYAKREKVLIESISSNTLYHEFQEKSRYFLFNDGIYYPVKSKKSVLKIFENYKHELNQLLRSNRIHFYDNREQSIIRLCEFYDSLKK